MLDMESRRLNLTIPAHFDALLDDLADLSGRSKSSFVLDAVAAVARHWQEDIDRLRGIAARQATSPAQDDDQVVLPPSSTSTLSRQQRRRVEREQRKKEVKG